MNDAPRTRVFLIEDQSIVSAGIRAVVAPEPDLCIVGEAASADRGLLLAGELAPDVVVLPMIIEGEPRGFQLGTRLKQLEVAPKVLIYSSYNSPAHTASSFLSGADSFVHRTVSPARLLDAIRATARGRRVWLVGSKAPRLANLLNDDHAASQLTQREHEVLGLMLEHRTNAEIAAILFIEVTTVKSHVRKVLGKLGLHGRRDLFEDRWHLADVRYGAAEIRGAAGQGVSAGLGSSGK